MSVNISVRMLRCLELLTVALLLTMVLVWQPVSRPNIVWTQNTEGVLIPMKEKGK